MKPRLHAISSAKRFGGVPDDYQDIHDYMDSTKAILPDVRHRIIFHSSFGCYLVEQKFGIHRQNSDNKEYSPRDVAEQHILEDLGFIPSLEHWLKGLPIEAWMGGKGKKLAEVLPDLKKVDPVKASPQEYLPLIRDWDIPHPRPPSIPVDDKWQHPDFWRMIVKD
jgi:hypothetical protein